MGRSAGAWRPAGCRQGGGAGTSGSSESWSESPAPKRLTRAAEGTTLNRESLPTPMQTRRHSRAAGVLTANALALALCSDKQLVSGWRSKYGIRLFRALVTVPYFVAAPINKSTPNVGSGIASCRGSCWLEPRDHTRQGEGGPRLLSGNSLFLLLRWFGMLY